MQVYIDKLWDVDLSSWMKGDTVCLQARGAARPWICRNAEAKLIALFSDSTQALDFYSDWKALFKEDDIIYLPELPLTADKAGQSALWVNRGELFEKWRHEDGKKVLVSTPGSLVTPLSFVDDSFTIVAGEVIGRDNLARWLQASGYEPVDLVWSPGQLSIRGSLVDLFDPVYRYPIRVEFFDDEVISIRAFDSETQKSIAHHGQIEIHRISGNRVAFPIKLLPSNCRVLLFEPKDVEAQADIYSWLWRRLCDDDRSLPLIPDWQEVYRIIATLPHLRISSSLEGATYRFDILREPYFKGQLENANAYLNKWQSEGYEISLYAEARYLEEWAAQRGINLTPRMISAGFVDLRRKYVALSQSAIMGIEQPIMMDQSYRKPPSDWQDSLEVGQYVVHEDYGVAIFRGTNYINGSEYLVLEYGGQKRLLVPAYQLYKITPYEGIYGVEPQLDRLDRQSWKRNLQKARDAAHKVAQDLISLYASRELKKGFVFPKDGEMSKHFEVTFPYHETADQLKAIEEIKNDMEKPVPMDRILVGDVGFGKTEVAMRAAIKAVEGGKQVAVLVPTTLLSEQHYESFVSRIGDMPIRIEQLSRFETKAKQQSILKETAEGRVDILIGTHRLLQGDVRFKDLGLVIIDEEHRFGVRQKELLKKLRTEVDVLSISATPIPRTLYMALSGIRDISLLSTPPKDRQPVITVVGPWRDDLVREAILKEISRDGRVFFVHDRIRGIEKRAKRLQMLVPEAKVGIAHGQLPKGELENAMLKFLSGEINVLVCTTIIESGLDIAKANTLIVDNAHMFGLSQLHQLRGRVGRRNRQAFAYMLYPADKSLTKEAMQRLEAIAECNQLGAGYRLALRDLEIRGGGNLLGVEQHGQTEKVGFQLYYKLIENAMRKLKGEDIQGLSMDIKVPLSIPEDYIPQDSLRMALYRRLLRDLSIKDIDEMEKELADRFGPLPEEMKSLLNVTRLKAGLPHFGVEEMTVDADEIVLRGKDKGLLSLVGGKPGWMTRGDRAVGPGGIVGLKVLVKYMTSAFKSGREMVEEWDRDAI
ncbi:transcription-repair coupling factor [Acetomicrobium flavidum]|uniref:transcription-repair coupling factor n=1 Tax=Acetomicrobium flavidum TaxID=49896 RepID=UPI003461741C